MAGPMRSTLTSTTSVAATPFWSIARPVTLMPAPPNEIVCGGVHDDTGESAALQVNVTVVGPLFQPNALGSGDSAALMCGPTTAKSTALLGRSCFVTATGPVDADAGTT